MPFSFTPLLRLKRCHVCDQWHASYRLTLQFAPNTEGTNHSDCNPNHGFCTNTEGTSHAKPTAGFDAASLANTNSKCHICAKTVYAMEFIGASGKAFHKNCFRCKVRCSIFTCSMLDFH
jgi:hypothetical protein